MVRMMEIFESVGDIGNIGKGINSDDVEKIIADGVTILSGNRVLRLSVTEETETEDGALKAKYDDAIAAAIERLSKDFTNEKAILTKAYRDNVEILQKELDEVEVLKQELRPVPVVDYEFASQGLSVAKSGSGYIWYYKCVYAPKYFNERLIEPKFAKRLITPITIQLSVSDNICTDVKLLTIIGDNKFMHYHSLSDSQDCWGDFKYSGVDISDQRKAFDLAKNALAVLETVNGYSIGTDSPRGLPRFSTLEQHLLDAGTDVDENVKLNSRHTRSGITVDVNESVNDNIWTVDV